jgi:hypothetical protein
MWKERKKIKRWATRKKRRMRRKTKWKVRR